jgi:acetolactate synthase small subunit
MSSLDMQGASQAPLKTASQREAESLRPGALKAPRPATFCFSVIAEAEPGVLPRVLELFAKRNLVPERWVADRLPGGGQLAVDIQVFALETREGDYIARCLREIWGVETVLTAVKG